LSLFGNHFGIKEPFLLICAAAPIVIALLPITLQRKGGRPFENQIAARIAFAAIGLALLLLWFSLPSK
jgi:hypothetical protein